MSKTYKQLEKLFNQNKFREIDKVESSLKFYYLRTISRTKDIDSFCEDINYKFDKNIKINEKLDELYQNEDVSVNKIKEFIDSRYIKESTERYETQHEIIKELNKVKEFNWGGSNGNSLEKNIVNNFVKKINKFSLLNSKIENEIFNSMRGYTVNSWYNHWSSIMIEDIFKDSDRVTPTIGLVKKIDFFIDDVPYDLKVTYFPDGYMKQKLREKGIVSELTNLKKIAKNSGILFDNSLKDKALLDQLITLIKESQDKIALSDFEKIKKIKEKIIDDVITEPNELIKWLYENQGEARFDAANRFFLVLIDKENLQDSWKLKRNYKLLKENIDKKINDMEVNKNTVTFNWKDETFEVYSDILFIVK